MHLYAFTAKEMRRLGAQDGEISIYSIFGAKRCNGVFQVTGDEDNPSEYYGGSYAYYYDSAVPDDTPEIRIQTNTDADGVLTMTVYPLHDEKPYRFEMEEKNNILVQIGGPAKPFTIANFGTRPLRVDTISGGKFTVPCGMIRRLEGVGNRQKRKVLLTVKRDGDALTAEMLDMDGSWRKLDIVSDDCNDLKEVRDDGAIVAQLRCCWNRVTMLDRLEKEPDYDVFIRKGKHTDIRRYAMRLVNGLPGYGEMRVEGLEDGTVYDFAKLRQGMAPEQCVAVLPNVRPMPESDCSEEDD